MWPEAVVYCATDVGCELGLVVEGDAGGEFFDCGVYGLDAVGHFLIVIEVQLGETSLEIGER